MSVYRGDYKTYTILMIHSKDFTTELIKNNLGPIIEVPCSYFKDFFNYLWESKRIEIINPANEALVMGVASGYYLSTRKIPIVAIQNSGFMNTLNALTSLNQLYEIPVFYLITWRGEGGKGYDAPEHDITGEKMEEFLKTFDIPYEIIDEKKYSAQIQNLTSQAEKTKKPVVLIIKKNTFEKHLNPSKNNAFEMSRYEAIKLIKDKLTDAIFLSTTGYPTRDSFAAKKTKDFYIVGSMGHAFSLALGISPNVNKKVVVLDGDGSSLMHLGGLASFDSQKHQNIIYFVLDNGSYESTGGQPTVSTNVNFELLAESFGFKNIFKITQKTELEEALDNIQRINEPAFIDIKIRNDEGVDRERVSDQYTCPQIKVRFMENFNHDKNSKS